MPEVYAIKDGKRVYAGYAKFDEEGNYLGSFGGYGSRANGTVSAKTPQGRGVNNGNPRTGNNRKNKAIKRLIHSLNFLLHSLWGVGSADPHFCAFSRS